MGVGEVVEEWSVGGCGVGSREGVGFGGDVMGGAVCGDEDCIVFVQGEELVDPEGSEGVHGGLYITERDVEGAE